MAYYHVCPQCGSHLDPGETCDCKHKAERRYQTSSIERARDSPDVRIYHAAARVARQKAPAKEAHSGAKYH